MTKVLLVLSSVRDSRVADKILELVQNELKNFPDLEVDIADFKKNPLPLIDSPDIPASEDFNPTDENVNKWTNQVISTDAIVILEAEYNHSYTPIIKNAIDWIYKPWINKPVAFIGYGWVGGARAIKHLRDVFASNISANVLDTEANLCFTKDIELDGTPIGSTASQAINNVLKAIQNV